ncbi:cbb3-type cytochrome c oxidase subunit 3 [Paraferrimonas sp. SM1919]|uniref:cbb3-type cytochrome oxidase subunit 3 n=1 Tax=Paraferrimonas sp. SM1919 TaxID=2662263 RepID=UPI0013D085EB|nr:cbb3-type cytochrome c oxidase subunit 3 [Paraferrimonas sp. SM1919]
MDYGTFQGILTILMMIIFAGIFAWAYSSRQKKRFDEAANLVFSDEQKPQESKADSGDSK